MQDKIVKKYDEFVKNKGFRRMLSRLIVEGQVKTRFFWQKSRNFELHIFFTAVKKTILQIEVEGDVSISELKLPFKIGSHISEAHDWCKKEGHEITFELNR